LLTPIQFKGCAAGILLVAHADSDQQRTIALYA
jgi:hypothetical protein